MKFWDSSAVLPLVVEEPPSRACRDLLRSDPVQIVWCLTVTEVTSALCRLNREGVLDDEQLSRAEVRSSRLARRWHEVESLQEVREEAARQLHLHHLRAADSLQLAAAVLASQRRPRGRGFVSLDEGLLAAAQRQGFALICPSR
jgi:hypothetical protein